MGLSTNKLFYVRNLQKRVYFPNDELIGAIFMLEKFLFDNYSFTEEVPLKILKQKWIYESIKNDDYTNDITKNFLVFKDLKIKKNVLELIETFSAIPNLVDKNGFQENFVKFNKKFNFLINNKGGTLVTSLAFQFILLIYLKKFQTDYLPNDKYLNANKNEDLFEIVFIEIFKKKNTFNISKSYYLLNLILKLIKR